MSGAAPACPGPRRTARGLVAARLAVALVCLVPGLSSAEEAPPATVEQRFEAANAAFGEGRYAEARDGFARLICEEGASAALLFNLGNASFRAGDVGEAILAWERALLLAPRDPDVRANLRQARSVAELEPPPAGAWAAFTRLLNVDGWAWAASGALWVLCGALLAMRLPREDVRPTLHRGLRPLAACTALALLVAAAACFARLRDADRAVVLGADPVLRVAPYASATASSELTPGEIVHVEREHGGFTLVRTSDGKSGWIADASVGRIALPVPCPG